MVEKSAFEEKVLEIKRVSKKTKGGNKISFSALVLVGDKNGSVGLGKGKALDVPFAIQKAITYGKRRMVKINIKGSTIPHMVTAKFKASYVILKPAPEGAGIIAGGAIRQLMAVAGVKDISAKMLGSNNKETCAKATFKALSLLKSR